MKVILWALVLTGSLVSAGDARACRYIYDSQGNPIWDCGDDNPNGGCWWDVDQNGNSIWTCSNAVNPDVKVPVNMSVNPR
jgi:hypothetical protein